MHEDMYQRVFGQPDDEFRTPKTTLQPGRDLDIPLGLAAHSETVQWAAIREVRPANTPGMLSCRVLIIEAEEYTSELWDTEERWQAQSEVIEAPEGLEIAFSKSLVEAGDEGDERHWSRNTKLAIGATVLGSVVTVAGIVVAVRHKKKKS